MVKYIRRLVLVFLMLVFFALSLSSSYQLLKLKNVSTIYLYGANLTVSDITDMQTKEGKNDLPVSFSGWVQKDEQDLYYPTFNRYAQADVVYVCGDSNLVLDSIASLRTDDKDGCLISEDVAYSLFGNVNVKNNKLLLGNRELTVRGMLKGETTLVVQAIETIQGSAGNQNSIGTANTPSTQSDNDNNQELVFRAIAVDTSGMDNEEKDNIISSFEERHGIAYKNYSNVIYTSWANFFSSILPIVSTLIIFFSILKKGVKTSNKPFICLTYLSTGVISLIIAMYIYKVHIGLPPNLIPNLWSDFDFWSKHYEDYVKDVTYLFYILKQKPEISYIVPLVKTIGYSLITISLFFILNFKLKIDSAVKLFSFLCMCLVIEYLIIIVINTNGLQLGNILMFWFMYPFYLVGNYFIGIKSFSRAPVNSCKSDEIK
ncbi:MAG TPA: hypothetical protein VIK78_06290 [Ruminiclostridium sp.]